MLRRHVSEPSAVVAGTVLAQRYRLDATIQKSKPIQGVLWRGVARQLGLEKLKWPYVSCCDQKHPHQPVGLGYRARRG